MIVHTLEMCTGDTGPEQSLVLFDSMRNHNVPKHEISNNVVCAFSKGSDQPALMHSLVRAFASRLTIL